MGGPGSGRRDRWQDRKRTVEESLTLAVRDLRVNPSPSAAGTLTWTRSGEYKASVGYSVAWGELAPRVVLAYRWQDIEDVRLTLELQPATTRFGGRRWWFTCPLVVFGVPCHRRAGKLYLPPRGRYFGCRRCHGLTYRSSQEAHVAQRMLLRLGFGAADARLFMKKPN